VVHHVEDFVERRTISWFNGAIAKRQAISTAHWERTLKATVVVDLPDGGDEFTSAGMKWSDVPEHARYKAAWIDGRHGPTRARLPTIEIEPVPDILHRLPSLHDDRPRGSKAMFDAGGANAVCAVRVPVRGSSVRTRDGNGRCGRTARSVGCPLSWNCPPTCSSRHAMMFSKRAIIGAGARSYGGGKCAPRVHEIRTRRQYDLGDEREGMPGCALSTGAQLASIVCPPEILAQWRRAVLTLVRAQAEAIPKSIQHEQAECAAEQARKDVKKGRPHRQGSR
jgi:hypothetical protein